jgi:diketogulonate reductase-like aldo/keto reductase
MEAFKKINIPSISFYNGDTIPQLGYGTYMLDGQEVAQGLKAALSYGYTMIDTAPMYENEDAIGNFIQKHKIKREDIFLTTKVGPDMHGKSNAIKSCITSLTNLNTEYIDLLIIHWPGVYGKGNPAEQRYSTWEGLISLHEDKKVKNIGVSNYYTKHLRQLLDKCDAKPVLNQIEIHPLCFPKETIEYCQDNKIIVESYCPMAQQDSKLVKNKVILKLAEKYKKSPSQICIKWGLQNGFVVIPRSKKAVRIKENCDVFDFEIEEEEMELITGLNCDYHVDWDPTNIK